MIFGLVFRSRLLKGGYIGDYIGERVLQGLLRGHYELRL